jgi:hypothetical protein
MSLLLIVKVSAPVYVSVVIACVVDADGLMGVSQERSDGVGRVAPEDFVVCFGTERP